MAKPTPPKDHGKGTGEPGWTPQEKGQDASGESGTDQAAEDARPKGRPSDDREATERAAEQTERGSKE
jgi:hypothetical protein